jgi:hypothetical protein
VDAQKVQAKKKKAAKAAVIRKVEPNCKPHTGYYD